MIEKLKAVIKKWPRFYNYLSMNKKALQLLLPIRPDPSHCFPTIVIHTNHDCTQKNWGFLNRGYNDEEFTKMCINLIRTYTMVTYDGLVSLFDITGYVIRTQIPGAFVETGVYKGGAIALAAMSIIKYGGRRNLHLFDSFEGLPQPVEKEYLDWMGRDWNIPKDKAKGLLIPTGACSATKQSAEEVLFKIARYPAELVEFHVGWFQDTVPIAASNLGPIALLRLDGDLYESTFVCLRHLYPLVVKGGFIIIDDYALKGARMALEEYFNEIGISPYLHHVDGTVRYFVKQ